MPSIVIMRPLVQGVSQETWVPDSLLRGLLPEALLEMYHFWQRPDGNLMGERHGPQIRGAGAPVSDSDQLNVIFTDGQAVVWRAPLDSMGRPKGAEARRLICGVYAVPFRGLGRVSV